jgi:Domain of unknown function (DUF4407)
MTPPSTITELPLKAHLTYALCWIAGVDRHLLASCPGTDRLWATHLGLSLVLSSIVVFGITYHATSYIIDDVVSRVGISAIVALVICFFDRAIFQADWFDQGASQGGSRSAALKRALRLGVRLAFSIGLAYVLSIFLELSIFSGPISERISQEYTESNKGDLARVVEFEQRMDEELRSRRDNLSALRQELRREPASQSIPSDTARAAIQTRISEAAESRARVQAEQSKARADITANRQRMAAEEFGQSTGDNRRTPAGRGPNYRFAAEQVAIAEQDERRLLQELQDIDNREKAALQELEQLDQRERVDFEAARAREDDRRDRLDQQIAREEQAIADLEAARSSRIEAFRSTLMQGRDISDLLGSPLARMTAYRSLKEDPVDGPTIQIFSLMTKGFVIFLEIMPILAKMIFSPPTVYSSRIRAKVDAEREKGEWIASKPPETDAPEAILKRDGGPRLRAVTIGEKPQIVQAGAPGIRLKKGIVEASDEQGDRDEIGAPVARATLTGSWGFGSPIPLSADERG